jgi:hypothetical protein
VQLLLHVTPSLFGQPFAPLPDPPQNSGQERRPPDFLGTPDMIDVQRTAGARNSKQVDGIIGAMDFRLTPSEIAEVESQ